MNRIMKVALCLIAVLIVTATGFPQSANKNALQGVWKLAEVNTTGPNAATNRNPQPGFYIFSGKYYSIVTVNSDKPRVDLPQDQTQATAAQLLDAWGSFTAQTGTYEVKGNEVTVHPLAAKNPGVMKQGNFNTSTFKIQGNFLTLVTKASQDGPTANPTTRKLTRVE